MRATVLLSGGIDSAACAYLLQRKGYEIHGLFVDFDQAAAKLEKRAAERIAERLNIPLSLIGATSSKAFGSGELSGRNAFLIFSALLLTPGEPGLIAIGIHVGTAYYDCSAAFFNRIEVLVKECTDGRVAVSAPFLGWSKDDVYNYFLSTGIPISETYSCEAGSDPPCCSCNSCRDRARLHAR